LLIIIVPYLATSKLQIHNSLLFTMATTCTGDTGPTSLSGELQLHWRDFGRMLKHNVNSASAASSVPGRKRVKLVRQLFTHSFAEYLRTHRLDQDQDQDQDQNRDRDPDSHCDLDRDRRTGLTTGQSLPTSPDQVSCPPSSLPANALTCYHQWTKLLVFTPNHTLTYYLSRLQAIGRYESLLFDSLQQVESLARQTFVLDTPIQPGRSPQSMTLDYAVAAMVVLAQHPLLQQAVELWSSRPRENQLAQLERACLVHLFAYQQQLRQPNHRIRTRTVQTLALLVTMVTDTDARYGCGEQQNCAAFLGATLSLLYRLVHTLAPENQSAWDSRGVIIRCHPSDQVCVECQWSAPPSPIQEETEDHKHLRVSLDGLVNTPASIIYPLRPTDQCPSRAPPARLRLQRANQPVTEYQLAAVVWYQDLGESQGYCTVEQKIGLSTWMHQAGQWQTETSQWPSWLSTLNNAYLQVYPDVRATLLMYHQIRGDKAPFHPFG
jgi:hypothetical protein